MPGPLVHKISSLVVSGSSCSPDPLFLRTSQAQRQNGFVPSSAPTADPPASRPSTLLFVSQGCFLRASCILLFPFNPHFPYSSSPSLLPPSADPRQRQFFPSATSSSSTHDGPAAQVSVIFLVISSVHRRDLGKDLRRSPARAKCPRSFNSADADLDNTT